jgi:hypothetical protein
MRYHLPPREVIHMTPEIHRAALRAAARLALPAFIVACGSTAPNTNEDSNTVQSSEEDLSANACKSKVDRYCASQHPYETKEMCCANEVKDATFPQPPHWGPDPDKRVDALTRGCCQVLADVATKKGEFDFPQRGECCPAIGWNASGSCTPWGPPVPPAMKRKGLAELAA